jgi:hypothetical protein
MLIVPNLAGIFAAFDFLRDMAPRIMLSGKRPIKLSAMPMIPIASPGFFVGRDILSDIVLL